MNWINKNIIKICLVTLVIVVGALKFTGAITVGDSLNLWVLTMTAAFIAEQARATYKMVEGSQRAGIDISLIFDKSNASGTSIQIINKVKSIPAIVWTKMKLNIDGKEVDEQRTRELLNNARLIGEQPWYIGFRSYISSSAFLTKLTSDENNSDVEVILTIDTAPTFNEDARQFSEEKTYRFDKQKREWIDQAWGMPDKVNDELAKIRNN